MIIIITAILAHVPELCILLGTDYTIALRFKFVAGRTSCVRVCVCGVGVLPTHLHFKAAV
jgi:hypothetical protein